MEVCGANALVTGAGRRIGRAITLALADRGANVMIHYNTSESGASATKSKASAHGVQAETVQADLSRPEDVEEIVESTRNALGDLQILINNASIFNHVSFRDTTLKDWEQNQQINLTAPVQLMQCFAEQTTGEGRIVNLLDWRALRPQARQFAYSVSKTGLAGATMAAAQELGPEITVNGVAPGPILPPKGEDQEKLDHIVEDLPAGRWGDVNEVVRAVIFFIESAGFVTGEVLHVDGGRHLM